MTNLRTKALTLATGLAAIATVFSGTAYAQYPERPIEMVVPWGAGGGTDAVGRIIGSLLEQDLGQPVNVVNRTGGSGVVGHSAIATAKPDGYTIGVITVEIAMMRWQGLTDLSYKDYTPIAQVNQDFGGLSVAADSEYKTASDLLSAIKKAPAGTFTDSGTGQGGIWHIGLLGWLMSENIDPAKVTFIPSKGAAAGLKEMLSGGVSFVTCSNAEAAALIKAGRVRALAHMGPERLPEFPDVPTLKEATGSDWTVAVWRMIGGPKGLPQEVLDVLVPAVKKAYESKEFSDFMSGRGFGMVFNGPEETYKVMEASDADFGKVMKKAGLAK
eukprot:Anaeramoba_ignava/a217256_13.p1 GENE.a217256_13~~a217256_13.p1  ORF type:complete len:328 (-),score=-32.08 a217256_13:399-1382(-)